MKPIGDKSHLFVTTEKSVSVNTDGNNVTNKKKLLDITFDSYLPFEGHITSPCEKSKSKTTCSCKNSQYGTS